MTPGIDLALSPAQPAPLWQLVVGGNSLFGILLRTHEGMGSGVEGRQECSTDIYFATQPSLAQTNAHRQ